MSKSKKKNHKKKNSQSKISNRKSAEVLQIVSLIKAERDKTKQSTQRVMKEKKTGSKNELVEKVIGTTESEMLSPAEKPKSRLKRYSGQILSRFGAFIKFFKWIIIIILVLALLSAGAAFGVWYQYGRDLPDVRELATHQFAQTTTIYDREGNVLYRIYGEENRKYVPLKLISKHVIDATISIEDQSFYYHFGFDPVAILRAQMQNLQEDDIVQGASTITQQLAKNLYLQPEKTFDRKVKELILSLQIEWYFDKDQILELYFNKIPYGSNAFGVEAAAKTFFDKSSSDLTLAEASILAALPKAPSYYSPYGSHKNELMGYCKSESCTSPFDANYVWGRKDLVLEKMVQDDKITQQEFEQAWADAEDIEFKSLKHEINSPHFVFYVRDYLEKKYGKEMVESGGLEVKTTLDPNLQSIAESIISTAAENGELSKVGANNAALISLEPSTGGVLAMVGSVDYWNNEIDGQVNVTTSLRQPGSAFKPLVYGAAIKYAGIGSGTVLGDYQTKFEGNYVPSNSDDSFKGRLIVRQALAMSRNIPAIKAFYITGEENVLEFLGSVGVQSLIDFKNKYNSNPERKWDFKYGGAMAIGSGEIQLLELAGGYSAYANNGKFAPVNPILEIRNSDGELLEQYQDQSKQVMDPQVAFIINDILSDSAARPAGLWRNTLTIPDKKVAAKTGTSNKKVGKINLPNNLLTVGYTPSIVTAVWIGNSDGKQLRANSWGLTGAAPLWNQFMTKALEGKPLEEFAKPEGIIEKGGQFFPSWWDSKKNFDSQFKPAVRKDCTDEERLKDPVICKTKEEMQKAEEEKLAAEKAAAEEALKNEDGIFVSPEDVNQPEKPLNTENNVDPTSTPDTSSPTPVIDELPPEIPTQPEKPLNSGEKAANVLAD